MWGGINPLCLKVYGKLYKTLSGGGLRIRTRLAIIKYIKLYWRASYMMIRGRFFG